jgi:cephalosporin hydroxylase
MVQEYIKKMRRGIKLIFHPTRKDYRKRFKMNLAQWLLYHQKNIVFEKCHWMGVRTLKNPLDVWIYQEIIHEVKPDIIIEIGSAEGGSTLYFANLLDLLGKGKVISIDIDRTKFNIKHDRVFMLTGDSSSPEISRKVSEMCRSKIVMVIHDGGHSKQQVLKDLEAYSNLVSLNGYFIVEDGIVDLFSPGDGMGLPEEGPLAAVEEFLISHKEFAVDVERERYILTYNPKGFLKRIRNDR